MTQPDILELAKQGHPHIIAGLLNRSLRSKGIVARATQRGDTLYLLLEFTHPPDQSSLVHYIRQRLTRLNVVPIPVVIYARQQGETRPAWRQILRLTSAVNLVGSALVPLPLPAGGSPPSQIFAEKKAILSEPLPVKSASLRVLPGQEQAASPPRTWTQPVPVVEPLKKTKLPSSVNVSVRWAFGILVMTTTVITVYGISVLGKAGESTTALSQPTETAPTHKVTALGRLEPQTEIIRLSPPLVLDGDRLAEVLVKQGDRVKTGQVIAVLDSRDRLRGALLQAQENVRVAESRLAQVRAGAKAGEIQAQQSTIVKLQAQLQGEIASQNATIAQRQFEVTNALAEYRRAQMLYGEGAIPTTEMDRKRLMFETAQAQLNEATAQQNGTSETLQAQISEARATLSRIREVRPVDVQVAQSEVDRAIVAVKQAETDLDQVYIRAPMAGQILKIHSRPGEKLSDAGIADLGQTDDMVVVAEVYQSDIEQVRVGQSAVMIGQAFTGEVKGTVYEVGLQISQQTVFNDQPGENLDRRVIEVKIRLNPEDSKRVANLTNLQVQVAIDI